MKQFFVLVEYLIPYEYYAETSFDTLEEIQEEAKNPHDFTDKAWKTQDVLNHLDTMEVGDTYITRGKHRGDEWQTTVIRVKDL